MNSKSSTALRLHGKSLKKPQVKKILVLNKLVAITERTTLF